MNVELKESGAGALVPSAPWVGSKFSAVFRKGEKCGRIKYMKLLLNVVEIRDLPVLSGLVNRLHSYIVPSTVHVHILITLWYALT